MRSQNTLTLGWDCQLTMNNYFDFLCRHFKFYNRNIIIDNGNAKSSLSTLRQIVSPTHLSFTSSCLFITSGWGSQITQSLLLFMASFTSRYKGNNTNVVDCWVYSWPPTLLTTQPGLVLGLFLYVHFHPQTIIELFRMPLHDPV